MLLSSSNYWGRGRELILLLAFLPWIAMLRWWNRKLADLSMTRKPRSWGTFFPHVPSPNLLEQKVNVVSGPHIWHSFAVPWSLHSTIVIFGGPLKKCVSATVEAREWSHTNGLPLFRAYDVTRQAACQVTTIMPEVLCPVDGWQRQDFLI